jgi:peroxiredoxin
MVPSGKATRQARQQQRAAERRQAQLQSALIVIGLVVIVGVVLALTLSAPGSTRTSAWLSPAKVGQPIGNFTLTDVNGVTHSIGDYKGRPVLINAWATWCPPCRGELPDLNAFYLKHQAEGFELLAINSGESQPVVADFIKQMGYSFPALVDESRGVLSNLGVDGLPTSILVGRDGTVKYIHIGGLSPDMIRTQLEPLITQ